jgi:hypothetical protein
MGCWGLVVGRALGGAMPHVELPSAVALRHFLQRSLFMLDSSIEVPVSAC